jgi:hypothetical protein
MFLLNVPPKIIEKFKTEGGAGIIIKATNPIGTLP